MKISVVIPAKNEERVIKDCIRSLLTLVDLPNEIIVVDNGSKDGTYDEVKKMQLECKEHDIQLTLLSCLRGDQIEARQLGFRSAKHPLIISLDADSHLSPNWISRARQIFIERDDVVAVGGPLVYDTLLYNIIHRLVYLFYVVNLKKYYFYGSNACFRKKAYIESDGLAGCRAMVQKYNFSEPYDDLYLSYSLKRIGIVKADHQLKAKVTSRVQGKRVPRWQLLKRLFRQCRDTLVIQKMLMTKE